jgi:hypothetical protein
MRGFLGLLAGIVAGLVGMSAISVLGTLVAPVHGAMRVDTIAEVLSAQPPAALAMVLLSWAGGALAAMAAAKAVARVAWPGWTLVLLLALALAATFRLDLPLWLKIGAVLAPLIGGALGNLLIRPRAPALAPAEPDLADAPTD